MEEATTTTVADFIMEADSTIQMDITMELIIIILEIIIMEGHLGIIVGPMERVATRAKIARSQQWDINGMQRSEIVWAETTRVAIDWWGQQ